MRNDPSPQLPDAEHENRHRMCFRRRIPNRYTLWVAALILLPVWYVLAAPFVVLPIERHFPAAVPILKIVYAPLIYVTRDSDALCHDAFKSYVQWCDECLKLAFGW